MTNETFAQRIIAMTETLYRVSYIHLSQSCDREEAVQECLCKAWQKRGQLRDERYLQTWVIRILINECHNIARRRSRETPLAFIPERVAPPGADIALHDALLHLRQSIRLPILLYYMEGYQINEIARILRLPQGTVKSRVARGRKTLKRMLSEEELAPCDLTTIF